MMVRLRTLLVTGMLLLGTVVASGQDIPGLPPQATPAHQWLKKFEGKWEGHFQASAGPDQPTMECTGTMDSRMLGELWVVNNIENKVGDVVVRGVQTIGYDADKKQYVGTWVDSMVNHMWQYEGSIDDSGKILALEADGPNFMQAGKMARFRDVYEFKADDLILVSSLMRSDDGTWVTFMSGEMRRKP